MSEKNNWFPSEQEIKDYELLKDMLNSQRVEFNILSKKKSDWVLNKMKIKIVNRVLKPLKELLKNEESYKFLEILDEDNILTNSDVILIISQYETAFIDYNDKYCDIIQ